MQKRAKGPKGRHLGGFGVLGRSGTFQQHPDEITGSSTPHLRREGDAVWQYNSIQYNYLPITITTVDRLVQVVRSKVAWLASRAFSLSRKSYAPGLLPARGALHSKPGFIRISSVYAANVRRRQRRNACESACLLACLLADDIVFYQLMRRELFFCSCVELHVRKYESNHDLLPENKRYSCCTVLYPYCTGVCHGNSNQLSSKDTYVRLIEWLGNLLESAALWLSSPLLPQKVSDNAPFYCLWTHFGQGTVRKGENDQSQVTSWWRTTHLSLDCSYVVCWYRGKEWLLLRYLQSNSQPNNRLKRGGVTTPDCTRAPRAPTYQGIKKNKARAGQCSSQKPQFASGPIGLRYWTSNGACAWQFAPLILAGMVPRPRLAGKAIDLLRGWKINTEDRRRMMTVWYCTLLHNNTVVLYGGTVGAIQLLQPTDLSYEDLPRNTGWIIS